MSTTPAITLAEQIEWVRDEITICDAIFAVAPWRAPHALHAKVLRAILASLEGKQEKSRLENEEYREEPYIGSGSMLDNGWDK